VRRAAALDDLPPPPPETPRQRLAYWQYRSVWELAAQLPPRIARRLPARIGRLWFEAAPTRQREQVARNLRRVAPDASRTELRDLVRDAYVSYARYWLDSFRLHTMDAEEVVAAATGEGLHHVDAFRDSGKGGILATGHLGSWDVGALFTSQRRWGLVVVAEVVEPRRLFDRFVQLRRQAGIEVIPLVRGGDMLDRLQRQVEQDGATATLLADRDLTRRGPIVAFFGEPCRLPPGTAALARRTGRPVAVGAFVTDGDTAYRAVIHAPVEVAHLDVHAGTQVVAAGLERLITRFPDQWHVFVPNWLVDREPEHPVAVAWREGRDWRTLAREDWLRRRPNDGERPRRSDRSRAAEGDPS
jgi:phosphatidylinositol dimannoside acyltransferase